MDIPFILDVIVSNPPYIKEEEKKDMERNVLDYEPHLALFVPDNDPLLYYWAYCPFRKEKTEKKRPSLLRNQCGMRQYGC